MKKALAIATFICSLVAVCRAQDRVLTYPAPDGAVLNDHFTVSVRIPGKDWQDVACYAVNVDEVRDAKHNTEVSTMAYFDFEGKVEVRVRLNDGSLESARVRPLSRGIEPALDGEFLTFSLVKPENLSIEVNGDIFHNLQLFANPVCEDIPDAHRIKKDKNLIYFGPGYHSLERGRMLIESGKTVFVAGGAFVDGTLRVKDATDVRIYGSGIVRPTRHNAPGVEISRSRNVSVEGIIVTQLPVGGSDGVSIRNVKSITHYGWGDGMNVFASNNVSYDGVFCRNSDDCTTVYATRKGYTGSCSNIRMSNSTLWADVAHPIMIGIHGNSENPDTIQGLVYSNIDILDHKEKQIDYQGCMTINGGDNNIIRDVVFEDIRVEDFREGQLLNIRIFFNPKYCSAPGQCIENVLFRNVSYNGSGENISIISGYDGSRMVKGVRFEHLTINGKLIHDDMPDKPKWYKTGDMAGIYIGEHVSDVTFVE